MKSSTPLAKVVAEALVLGVYDGTSAADLRVILFLARAEHGSWSVNGRYNSVGEDLTKRLYMPRESFRTALKRLTKAKVVTSIRLGYATTYALTTDFINRCRTLYEIRHDLQAIECYHKSQGLIRPSTGVQSDPEQGLIRPQHKRAQEEHYRSATADAARGLRPREGEPMSDFPTDDGFDPSKPTREHDSAALGEDPHKRLGPAKVVRGPDPRSKAVLAIQEYFRVKLTPFSERRKVPLFGQVGKMQKNIKFLLQQQHSPEAIEGAVDLFASQTESMYFQGESLWDMFFARRDEHIRLAAIHAIGSRGGPRESLADKGRRLMAQQQQQKDVQ